MSTKKSIFLLSLILTLFSCGGNKISGVYEYTSSSGELKSFNFISDTSVIIIASDYGQNITTKYRIEKDFVIITIPDIGNLPVEITKDGLKTPGNELFVKRAEGSKNTNQESNPLVGKTYIKTKSNDVLGMEVVTYKLFFLSAKSVSSRITNQFGKVYEDETFTYRIEGKYVIMSSSEASTSLEISTSALKGSDGLYYVKQ